ncbi:MAG: pyrroline-5-carboxylate reductase [Planctomycetota bacterium]
MVEIAASKHEVGFLGGGQMATAIARGVVEAGLVQPHQLAFSDPNRSQIARLQQLFPGCTVVDTAAQLFEASHRIVLAVKPQVLAEIANGLASYVQPHHLLISIAAGVPLAKLTHWLRTERIARVMPNTPCQVLRGASGLTFAHGLNEEDKSWCDRIFRSVGTVVHVPEEQLHAVTGVSGSGPAYVLMMIEALSDGGVAAGLSRNVSLQLAAQTVLGAAAMVQSTGTHPAILREQVTSPAGTTIAAIQALEKGAFRSTVIQAVVAAAERSKELSGPIRKTEARD